MGYLPCIVQLPCHQFYSILRLLPAIRIIVHILSSELPCIFCHQNYPASVLPCISIKRKLFSFHFMQLCKYLPGTTSFNADCTGTANGRDKMSTIFNQGSLWHIVQYEQALNISDQCFYNNVIVENNVNVLNDVHLEGFNLSLLLKTLN